MVMLPELRFAIAPASMTSRADPADATLCTDFALDHLAAKRAISGCAQIAGSEPRVGHSESEHFYPCVVGMCLSILSIPDCARITRKQSETVNRDNAIRVS